MQLSQSIQEGSKSLFDLKIDRLTRPIKLTRALPRGERGGNPEKEDSKSMYEKCNPIARAKKPAFFLRQLRIYDSHLVTRLLNPFASFQTTS